MFLELFNSFFIFILTIIFAIILYLHPKSIIPSTNTQHSMPLIVHRRGGVRRPNPRIPVVPPFTSDDQQQSDVPEASTSTAGRITENEEFEPGPKDLVDVRLILEKTGKLPPEVVDLIFDHAEYWASSTTTVDYRNLPGGHLVIRGGRPGEDRFLVSLINTPTSRHVMSRHVASRHVTAM